MDWLERLNLSLDYLETHLCGGLDYTRAAQIACCSAFHYQRMFSYIAGIPLGEYIRRRRMTEAAFDLQTHDMKILDAALKYGYDSPTSFNRAFQNVHGVPPTAARSEGVVLKAYPRIRFQISIKGDAEMNYRIETKEAFRIVGMKKRFPMDVEENFSEVPRFWQEAAAGGVIPKLCRLIDRPPMGILGVCSGLEGREFDYYIAAATDRTAPEGMTEHMVPACIWAIFECIGPMPKAIQQLQRRIISEWLPSSGYEYADGPDIEVYPEGDQQSPDYRCEAWIPVVKKK